MINVAAMNLDRARQCGAGSLVQSAPWHAKTVRVLVQKRGGKDRYDMVQRQEVYMHVMRAIATDSGLCLDMRHYTSISFSEVFNLSTSKSASLDVQSGCTLAPQ